MRIFRACMLAGALGWGLWAIYPIHFGLADKGIPIDDSIIRLSDNINHKTGTSISYEKSPGPLLATTPFAGYIFWDYPNADGLIPALQGAEGPVELKQEWNELKSFRSSLNVDSMFTFGSVLTLKGIGKNKTTYGHNAPSLWHDTWVESAHHFETLIVGYYAIAKLAVEKNPGDPEHLADFTMVSFTGLKCVTLSPDAPPLKGDLILHQYEYDRLGGTLPADRDGVYAFRKKLRIIPGDKSNKTPRTYYPADGFEQHDALVVFEIHPFRSS